MKMKKLDSFVKESFRMNMASGGISIVQANIAMTFRKVMKSFTFSNGVTLPAGATLATAGGAIQYDDAIYPNAKEFRPFRFSELREREGESAKLHSVNTSPEYLVFGHGEHACPGRFFAVNEVKLMLAFILLRYDIKTETGKRPANWDFGIRSIPDMSAKILFKRRT
jgi:cytochrome P450